MPSSSPSLSDRERHLLAQLGRRIRDARKKAGLSAMEMAGRVTVSRQTIHAVESGSPSTTIGTYLRVLDVLGMSTDLVLVASRLEFRASKPDPSTNIIPERLARLERDVLEGRRHPDALFSVPPDLARSARVSFPENAFGAPQGW